VTRLVLLCLVPILLALPATADCLDDIKAQLAEIRTHLAAGSVPPAGVPSIPAHPTPQTPGGGPYVINGQGTIRGVELPAAIRLTNIPPGSTLNWVKQPPVKLGRVRVTVNGQPLDGDGYGPVYNIPIGDYTLVFTPEVPGAVVAVQVR
jgi:hypothetical protein